MVIFKLDYELIPLSFFVQIIPDLDMDPLQLNSIYL